MRLGGSVLRWLYRVRVRGMEHYARAGPRVVIVANHTSFLDPALLVVVFPDALSFAIDPRVARLWWVRPFLGFVDVQPVDPASPLSAKAMIRAVRQDRKAVIFPEGRITVTGSLMKIYPGPAFVADRSGAMVLPVRISGAEQTPFSRLGGRRCRRWFPPITITVLPPRHLEVPRGLKGRARREAAAQALADLMAEMMLATSDYRRTLHGALLDARRRYGGRHQIAEDVDRKPITYDRLLTAVLAIGDLLARDTRPGETVGVLLPTSIPAMVTFLALSARGRIPAMLNYSAGPDAVLSAAQTAEIRSVYTSRRFVERAKLGEVVARLAEQRAVVYLEDIRGRIGTARWVGAWLRARVAHRAGGDPDAPAAILFTAGTEGAPKGVALSHANLLANHAQIQARLEFGPTDVVFNAMPLFHSFGLATGALLPLLAGVRVFLYPTPLDYRAIPEVAYEIGATIMFGTNTFLAGYARFADPYDFYRTRFVFAGAERLEPETRHAWAEKFGLRIFEGYGATETGPVLATSAPMAYRSGTVGRFLPGIEHGLEPVENLAGGGRLYVRGPNVMLGYLRQERPGVIEPPRSDRGAGWYDTGDLVTVGDDGFVTLQGRAKRFAKVGAEMVSLETVEQLAGRVWPPSRHAALSIPDPRRGEQIVLVTEEHAAEREALLQRARADGIAPLAVPRTIVAVDKMPLLGAGKIDYRAARALVEGRLPKP
ncbi:MAG: AMP-binding protein [Candidatus Rokuibacteriota bacterium]